MIGRYKLLQKLGEGGMGTVWMAEQREPVVRRVALKIIKAGMDTHEVVARFEQERQALAMMDHPAIAKVLDAGATDSGRPYFVMELVRGVSVTSYCDEQKLGVPERLGIFTQICQAIQHAHQKGVIHRDIKPSNILVTAGDDGEPLPKVIDFGIAKATGAALTDKTLFTQLEQIIGTPACMSPEQAGLGPLDIDTRSDVYALGVLLYELLTGRPPFDPRELMKAGLDEMRRVIREDEPPRPSTRISSLTAEELSGTATRRHIEPPKLASSLRGDLDWIVMKALEKNRNRRYGTASGLAADIQRFLSDEPITARAPGVAYLLSKFVRRHKVVFAAGSAVALALIGGIAAAVWGYFSAAAGREKAEATSHTADIEKNKAVASAKAATEANEANRRNLRLASMADLATAMKAWQEDFDAELNGGRAAGIAGKSRWHEAVVLLARSLQRDPGNGEAASWLYDTLCRRLVQKRDWPLRLQTYDAGFSTVTWAKFSSDTSKLLTILRGELASQENTGNARVWDPATGKPLGEFLQHEGSFVSAEFSRDGSQVVTVGGDHMARVWDAAAGRPAGKVLKHIGAVNWAIFSPDGATIATVGGDFGRHCYVQLWNAAEATERGEPLTHPDRLESIAFSPDGTKVVTGSRDMTARVWNAATGGPLTEALQHKDSVSAVSFSPDGTRVVTASYDGTARVWEADSGRPATGPLQHDGRLNDARFSPDGTRIITAGGASSEESAARSEFAQIWDAAAGKTVGDPLRHAHWVWRAAFNSAGTQVLTASLDGTARLWDARTGRLAGEPFRHTAEIRRAEFSPDGKQILTASYDRTVRLWPLVTGGQKAEIEAVTPAILQWASNIAGLRYDDDGKLAVIPDAHRSEALSSSALPAGPWARLAEWLNTKPPDRRIDVEAKLTLRQGAERDRDFYHSADIAALESALRCDPTVPLARLYLAAALENVATFASVPDPDAERRIAFLRGYDLDRLLLEEDRLPKGERASLWVRAAEHLSTLSPDTRISSGPGTRTARAAAVEAASKALRLEPGLPAAAAVLERISSGERPQ